MTTQSSQTKPSELVFALNTCIEACTDGEKGYALAAADVRDADLKKLFMAREQERAHFVSALQGAIQALGAFPENQGSAEGTAHRGWVAVRKVVEGRSDRMIAEECERGEQIAMKAYQVAIGHAPLHTLPGDLRALLERQYAAIETGLGDLKHRFA